MIASAASVAAAEGLGCFAAGLGRLAAGLGCLAAGLGCLAAVWGASCRAGRPPVGLEGCFLQIGVAWLQIGQASGRAGGQLAADRGCLAADWAVLP